MRENELKGYSYAPEVLLEALATVSMLRTAIQQSFWPFVFLCVLCASVVKT